MSKTRTLIILLVAAIILVIAAIATYVIVQNNRAPEALSPSPNTSSSNGSGSNDSTGSEPQGTSGQDAGSAFDPATLAGAWSVAGDSIAGYRVDEVLGGQDVTVVGRTEQVKGLVAIGDDAITSSEITVNVDSIETDSNNRDHEFRELLGTAENPDAVFVSETPVPLTLGQTTYEVPGTLTVAGTQAAVVATITATVSGDATQLVGNIPITFMDFGIEAPDMGFVTVEDEGIIEFALNMERK